MKKIYMILALAIIGLIASIRPVFSQGCEVCQNPWMCVTAEYNVAGCEDPVRTTFCYQCGISNGRPWVRIQVVEVEITCSNVTDAIENAAWDSAYAWARWHAMELCGYRPCDQPPFLTIYMTFPICGEVTWYGNFYTGKGRLVERARPTCDGRCVKWGTLCYDAQQNRIVFDPSGAYQEGTLGCDVNQPKIYGDDPIYEYRTIIGRYWQLDCTKIMELQDCN